MRAAKREKYGLKEDARLIKMLEEAGDYQVVPKVKEEPVEIQEPATPDPVTVMNQDDDPILISPVRKPISDSRRRSRSRKSRRDHQRGEYSSDDNSEDEAAAQLEMDTAQPPKEKVARIFNKKTKRDQFGNYPEWMSIRKIQKQKKQNKRLHSKRVRLAKCKK